LRYQSPLRTDNTLTKFRRDTARLYHGPDPEIEAARLVGLEVSLHLKIEIVPTLIRFEGGREVDPGGRNAPPEPASRPEGPADVHMRRGWCRLSEPAHLADCDDSRRRFVAAGK
jgi:hypothetical protein